MTKHVAVLMGGLSAEREVSLSSGAAVKKALEAIGYKVTTIDVGRDIASVLEKLRPDVVFNALHGHYGEDGNIQGILEILGIPYTHSGVLASALAMHKPMAKKVFSASGLRLADGCVIRVSDLKQQCPLLFPVVVKPIDEGSSVGVKIIHTQEEMNELPFSDTSNVLVEKYIPGREIQVAVLDGKALGAIEIKPLRGFYDYEAKYTLGKAEHIMPAPLSETDYQEVCRLAERAHEALGCRGLTRSDFRYDDTGLGQGVFYLLETNTQPGMTPLSLAPEIAAHVGISFNDIVHRLVGTATTDHAKDISHAAK
jgi:D-alanine-D-alanine ligase